MNQQQQYSTFGINHYIQPLQQRSPMDFTQLNNLININNTYDDKTKDIQSSIGEELKKYYPNLNEKDNDYLLKRTKEIEEQIENASKTMSPAKAYDAARKAASEIYKDKGMMQREAANKEYQGVKMAIDQKYAQGIISKDAYDRWNEQHQYHFNDVSGKLDTFKSDADKTLYNKVDWDDIIKKSFAYVSERSSEISTATSSNYDKDRNLTEKTITTQNAKGFAYKKKAAIQSAWKTIMNDSAVYAQVSQEMQDNIWKMSKLDEELKDVSLSDSDKKIKQDELNKLKDILCVNGVNQTSEDMMKNTKSLEKYIEYIFNKQEPIFETLSYINYKKSNSDSTIGQISGGRGNLNLNVDPNNPTSNLAWNLKELEQILDKLNEPGYTNGQIKANVNNTNNLFK